MTIELPTAVEMIARSAGVDVDGHPLDDPIDAGVQPGIGVDCLILPGGVSGETKAVGTWRFEIPFSSGAFSSLTSH